MTRYLISFASDAMDHIPDEEGPTWPRPHTRWSGKPRTPACGPLGGISVIDVPSREAALEWAVKIAAACRCPQEVSAFLGRPARLTAGDARVSRA